jgi:hypothetical protein
MSTRATAEMPQIVEEDIERSFETPIHKDITGLS